jgi:asparagine N-glycosylation enzyme membrane subunit Stt3
VALVLVLIFVKKEKDLVGKDLDNVSIGLNIVIAVVLLPFVSIYGVFIDINGSEAAFSHQMGYLVPAVVVLGLAASISLRRKGYSKGSFIAQFAGPAFFALHLLLSEISYRLS